MADTSGIVTVAPKRMKGLLANLRTQPINAGNVYVTTDEHGLYFDIDNNTRLRIGDFQEFPNYAALSANINPSTTALYYIQDINVLAKWNGTEYIQVNPDRGATSIEVVGTGNVITNVTYDAATRKMTFTKGSVDTTSAPVYSLVKDSDSGDYAAIYHLTVDGVNTGVPINIPRDLVVKSGSVVTENGKSYLVLVLNDATNTEVKIDASSLVEYVTSGSAAGDPVFITVDPTTHKVTASISNGAITKEMLSTELKTIVETVSGSNHEHANKTVLDGITAENVAAWNAAEANAKAYADALVAAMTAWGDF